MPRPERRVPGTWARIAGDDWVWVWEADDVDSAAEMATWSSVAVQIREGSTRLSDVLLSSVGVDPKINTAGFTFPDDGSIPGLVVPATDFSAGVLSWVILKADTVGLGKPGKDEERWIEVEVLVNGVATTIIPSRPLWVLAELTVRP